jgi:hypothetical protein
MSGVEAIYDRHQYEVEKGEALARLEALIDNILHSRSAEVVPMKGKKRRLGAEPAAL